MDTAVTARADAAADMAEAAERAGQFDRAHSLFDRAATLYALNRDFGPAQVCRERARTAAVPSRTLNRR